MRQQQVAQHTFLVGDIPITVTRKRIRHVHLRVHPPNGRVTMSAPHAARLKMLEGFAEERVEWIRRQQNRLQSEPREEPRAFVNGESYYLWGRKHILSVVERDGKEHIARNDGRITMFVKPGSDVVSRARVMHLWHREILDEKLPPLIQKWEQRLGVRLTGYYLRRMTTRWGTCNHRTRHIRLNTELVTKPSHFLEYVLVHELVHLIVPNHGSRFVALMDKHYPEWRDARTQLNKSMSTC